MIDVQGLSKSYGSVLAVDGASFRVGQGELLALVGDSGSGKTTTLKMINRLVEPSAGRVLVDGADVSSLPPTELRRRIGYVFQGVGLFPHLTVGENVGVPLRLRGWARERVRERVSELLRLVELDEAQAGRFPSALSGGQQQRVGVARALAASPQLVLLDEPFGALDPLTRDRIQESFQGLRRRLGLTAVMVTHDMAEALLLADRIGVMRGGRLVQIGEPADLRRAPADAEVARLLETPARQARVVEERLRGPA